MKLFSRPSSDSKEKWQMSKTLLEEAKMPLAELFKKWESSKKGLTEAEGEKRQEEYGTNEVAHEKPQSALSLLFSNFRNPFVVLVLVLGIISLFLKQYDSAIIIAFMVVVSVIMRFLQEYRSNQAAEKLKELVSIQTTVLRRKDEESEPNSYDIPIKNLVPGDIVNLSAGDRIPADIRLINAKELAINQSALTGESFPVTKDESIPIPENESNPLNMPNLCFMGTDIVNGTAQAIVVATGRHTYFGEMSSTIIGKRTLTSFDIGINRVTWLLIRFVVFMVPCIFVINGLTKGDWFEALLFALSVGVGLTPEMLPMIVTANLAKGAVQMAKSQVIVKRLNAIQNFGAMNILCTDKTGTLTENRIILEMYLDAVGKESEEVLLYGYLNSFYQTGLKNLLDLAVLQHKEVEALPLMKSGVKKIDELPFDFTRRRMSVIVQMKPEHHLIISKGAVEEVVAVCNRVKIGESEEELTEERRQEIFAIDRNISEDGLRVIAVGYKEVDAQREEYRIRDEQNLVFAGFLAFLDPPKLSAKEAIRQLNDFGVTVKLLTGDNERVTRKICEWVNLQNHGFVLGDQVESMSEEELRKVAEKTTIFAKLTPLQKRRIIRALKSQGHTVGYLGDGINDAPALLEADIGISVDTGVDIAKESSSIIMLQKSLNFLAEGVAEGRRTFGNIIKYIKMALSSNFGNVFTMIGASVIFPFLPMLPVQILLQNLLYDISQTAIPFDHVDQSFLTKPRKWDPRGIAHFMVIIGPISSIFDYVTFAVLWFVFGATTIEKQAFFQTGWFIEGLLSQTLIVHMIRTEKIPFIESRPSAALLTTTCLIMAIGIIIPFISIGKSIGLIPMPASYFGWLIAILLAYCTLTQFAKVWFISKFRYWL